MMTHSTTRVRGEKERGHAGGGGREREGGREWTKGERRGEGDDVHLEDKLEGVRQTDRQTHKVERVRQTDRQTKTNTQKQDMHTLMTNSSVNATLTTSSELFKKASTRLPAPT